MPCKRYALSLTLSQQVGEGTAAPRMEHNHFPRSVSNSCQKEG